MNDIVDNAIGTLSRTPAVLRNLRRLEAFGLDDRMLSMTAIHPEFGEVTLRQHLAAWVAHDLSHLARVLAKQYKSEVGPWIQHLSILH